MCIGSLNTSKKNSLARSFNSVPGVLLISIASFHLREGMSYQITELDVRLNQQAMSAPHGVARGLVQHGIGKQASRRSAAHACGRTGGSSPASRCRWGLTRLIAPRHCGYPRFTDAAVISGFCLPHLVV